MPVNGKMSSCVESATYLQGYLLSVTHIGSKVFTVVAESIIQSTIGFFLSDAGHHFLLSAFGVEVSIFTHKSVEEIENMKARQNHPGAGVKMQVGFRVTVSSTNSRRIKC